MSVNENKIWGFTSLYNIKYGNHFYNSLVFKHMNSVQLGRKWVNKNIWNSWFPFFMLYF